MPASATSSTRDRLVEAAIEEVGANGPQGATTRSIAARAGVNEVTLFRRFGSKNELLQAAVRQVIRPLRDAVREPTDDAAADLESVAGAFVGLIDGHPRLMARIMADMAAGGEFLAVVGPVQAAIFDNLQQVLEHHVRSGQVAPAPLDDAARAFMGPLVARALLSHVVAPGPFDATAHVQRWLHGWAGAAPEAP